MNVVVQKVNEFGLVVSNRSASTSRAEWNRKDLWPLSVSYKLQQTLNQSVSLQQY